MTWFHPSGRRDVDSRRRALESRDRQLAPLGYAIDAHRAARHCPRLNTSSDPSPTPGLETLSTKRCCDHGHGWISSHQYTSETKLKVVTHSFWDIISLDMDVHLASTP
jgi:hypothetical protein